MLLQIKRLALSIEDADVDRIVERDLGLLAMLAGPTLWNRPSSLET